MRTDRLAPAWLLPAWLLLSACPPRLHPPPPGAQPGAEQLLRRLRQARRALHSLRATAVVVARRGGRAVKMRAVVAAARPARLRLETESIFGQALSIMVTDKLRFAFWDMEHGRFLRGKANPDNLGRVLPVPLDGAELARTFLGEPPLIAYASARVSWDGERGSYLIELENSRRRQLLWLHPRWLLPLRLELYRQGKLLWRIELEARAPTSHLPAMVKSLTCEVFSPPLRLYIKLRELEANCRLPEDAFRLEPPPGVETESVE